MNMEAKKAYKNPIECLTDWWDKTWIELPEEQQQVWIETLPYHLVGGILPLSRVEGLPANWWKILDAV